MANPKWGTKRICQSCSAKFYDLQKSPIICPSCGAEFDPEALLKSRRPRSAPKPEPAPKPKKPKAAPANDEDGEDVDDDFEIEDDEADAAVGDSDDDDFIEDTEDLGDDDVAVVVEGEDET
ncbi:TIGR02300 family protein [Pelagibius sp. 7325]|uniref:TIGR02300 family protein n=1 Tax=Pelagibius sp. 7325 TaxID=3131994 RepID=UPI0030EB7CA4